MGRLGYSRCSANIIFVDALLDYDYDNALFKLNLC